ncbi:MAG: TonB-dependent receptor [bacterium]|nr:TonB-dependent receptor [bacterium]
MNDLRREIACLVVVLTTGSVWAGGYEVEAQDTTQLGVANAGKTTLADAASVLFWNPAALARLREPTLRFGVTDLHLKQEFFDEGTMDVLGNPALGATNEEGVRPAFIPAIAASWPIGEKFVLGIGLQSQFGLKTDWGTTWVGRYHATYSELLTLNLSSSVSWQVSEKIALGFGLGIQYADAQLENQIDFGSIGAALPSLSPQMNDGSILVDGDSLDLGATLGVLWDVGRKTRIGLGYRSEVEHELEGDADFDVPPEALPLTAGGGFMDTGATTKLPTPATASVGLLHEFSDKWTFMTDLTWVDWSTVDELRIVFDNPAQADIVAPEAWDDTVRGSAGATYRANDRWTWRGGFAVAPSPIPDSTRNVRLADSDRLWFSLGGSRTLGNASIDFAYIYIPQDDAPVDFTDPLSGRIAGNIEWTVHVLSLGSTFRF